jgi:hypothetical protein
MRDKNIAAVFRFWCNPTALFLIAMNENIRIRKQLPLMMAFSFG